MEEDEYFYKRMSGVLYLYFTILMDPNCTDGVRKAWIWMSDVLNVKPRVNITADMLTIFFKCCGFKLHKIYQNQFQKLVSYCIKQYVSNLSSFKSESIDRARLGRLNLILEDYIKIGHFEEWKK